MGTLNLDARPQPLFPAGQGSVLLVNNDETHTVYVDNNKSVTTSSVPLPPQGQITVDGTVQWWGATLSPATVQLVAAPGGTQWNNPVGVQIALSALGLAKDTTVNNVHEDLALGTNPYLGGTSAGALTANAGKSIAQDMLAAQSGVTTEIAALLQPGIKQANSGVLGASGTVIDLTGTKCRVWAVVLGWSVGGTPTSGGTILFDVSDNLSVLYLPAVVRVNNGTALFESGAVVLAPPVPFEFPSGAIFSLAIGAGLGATPDAIGAIMYSTP